MKKYKNESLPINERIEDLLSRMSLEQKVAQLQCMMIMGDPTDILKGFPNGLGEATAMAGAENVGDNAMFSKVIQETVMSKNELGIPVLLHGEALNGFNSVGGTIFPSAIGLGATWNPETVQEMTDIIRKQMLAVGVRQALSPVMDVARDPRWGRMGETYGEDPTLCAALSVAFTKGLQGENLRDGVVATAKHFLGYALGDGGLNMSSNPISPRELREVYAKPFQAAITEGEIESVMNTYGTLDGELVITSKHFLTELLRDEMGFDGIMVSDYMSINRAVDLKVSENPGKAGVEALQAGLDVECPMPYGYTQTLIEAVKDGNLDEAVIDRSVKRILATKFKLGMFENPFAKEDTIQEAYESEHCVNHSLKAARESIVLVKNDGILPLSKDTQNICVIGPHGDSLRLLFGSYTFPSMLEMVMSGSFAAMAGISGEGVEMGNTLPPMPFFEGSTVRQQLPEVTEAIQHLFGTKTPTILNSIKEKCTNAKVTYEKGCDIAGNNREGFEAAVVAAKEADVVILTIGGKFGWGNNCTTGEGVDCADIGLTGVQEELAKAIFETGTPTVLVHMDAKPLTSEYIANHLPAIIENWFPGETGGRALADVLFGDYNPAGRLPVTAARNVGQIPIYAMHRNGNSYSKANGLILNSYVDNSKQPLFYFGEGKSYTEFAYSNLKLDKTVNVDGVINLSVDVTNTGVRNGDEVVQVYVSDELASMVRPVKELAGFKRVAIEAGQTKTVHFTMKADQFAFLDANMKWVVEAGKMTVSVGASSEDIRLSDSFEIANTAYISGKDRGFYAKVEVTN